MQRAKRVVFLVQLITGPLAIIFAANRDIVWAVAMLGVTVLSCLVLALWNDNAV